MREKGVKKIIFSGTAATYGMPQELIPSKETDSCAPMNPYGTSKWMVEKILSDFDLAYGLKYVAFRYFNVAGADLKMECGERGTSPQNLIPIVLQVAAEKLAQVNLFGRDYPTRDGTAIRDYIHVVDIADAHVKALQYLLQDKPSILLNLGTGNGASVQEIIDMVKTVTKRPIPVIDSPGRAGDPSFYMADASLARKLLGWEPKHSDLKTIIESEWNWISRPVP
jgi:UDP-glucose 4-epimerase